MPNDVADDDRALFVIDQRERQRLLDLVTRQGEALEALRAVQDELTRFVRAIAARPRIS